MTQPVTEADVKKLDEQIASRIRGKVYEYLDRYRVVEDSKLEFKYATASLHMSSFIKQLYQQEFQQIWSAGNNWPFSAKLQLTANLIDESYDTIRKFATKLFGWAETAPVVFMASGSYARREAVPGSDVDARLIMPEKLKEEMLPFLQQVSEGAFGEGIRLAPRHQEVKWESPDENHQIINNSVLESRFIGGDKNNWLDWRLPALKNLKHHWKKNVVGQCAAWTKRHPPHPAPIHQLPRNKILKEGIGGLRELHFALWIGFPMALSECNDIVSLARLPHLPPEMAWASLKGKFRISDAREQEVIRAYRRLLEIRAIANLTDLRLDKLLNAYEEQFSTITTISKSSAELMAMELAKEVRIHQKTLLAFSSDIVRCTMDMLG